ncbi:hypothetical protein H0H92_009884, partial [Tricholoma furcatifolium]
MQSYSITPADDTTNVYAQGHPAISPIIAKAHSFHSTRRSEKDEWLVRTLINLGDRKLERGDTILLADISAPPPYTAIPTQRVFPEIQLVATVPYDKGHFMETRWKAFLVQNTRTYDMFTIHIPKRFLEEDPKIDVGSSDMMECEFPSGSPESAAEEITRRETQSSMEIRVQVTTE